MRMERRPLDDAARETANLLRDLKRSFDHNQERWRVPMVNRAFMRVLENQIFLLKAVSRLQRRETVPEPSPPEAAKADSDPLLESAARTGRNETGRLPKIVVERAKPEEEDDGDLKVATEELGHEEPLVRERKDPTGDSDAAEPNRGSTRVRADAKPNEEAPLLSARVSEDQLKRKERPDRRPGRSPATSGAFKNIEDLPDDAAQACLADMPVGDLNQWIEKDKSPFRIAGQHVFMNPKAFAPAAFDTIESHIKAMGFRKRLGVLFVKDMISPVVVYQR